MSKEGLDNASKGLKQSEQTSNSFQRKNSLSSLDFIEILTKDKHMLNFSSHLQWFQAKIGSYDKQIWETSVEQRILQGLENRPKRVGSLHKELIDIDLVRGSTFSKAKPRHGLKSVIFNGLKRVIFFPYYYNQWQNHLNKEVVYFFLFHYVIQMIQLTLYFIWSNSSEIMLEEILLPIILALSLGVLHAHIIAPYTVMQRRKNTYCFSKSKVKSVSKTESPVSNQSLLRQQSLQINMVQKFPESPLKVAKDKVRQESVQTCQENPCSSRLKKKNVLFKKSSIHDSEISDEDELVAIDLKEVQHGGYEGETETKDSSLSEQEAVISKGIEEETLCCTKHSEINDTSCTEVVSNNIAVKTTPKRIKVSDNNEKIASYSKMKSNIRKFSQSEVVNVTDEEDLKKFITAKNKHIPDPTPINNIKKDKDKTQRKGIPNPIQKAYKSSKSRRQTIDHIANSSGMSSGSTSNSNVLACPSSTVEPLKMNKSTVTESAATILSEEVVENDAVNGCNINQDIITDNSSDSQYSSTGTIETLGSKEQSAINTLEPPSELKSGQSVSQPHTPINHAGTKLYHRIEVRKVSSADASPTPSRKNTEAFVTNGLLNQDLELKAVEEIQLNNLFFNDNALNSSLDQGSATCLIEQVRVTVDNSISSEDYSLKINDLNEDTITKSHKKREEFKQLFVKKAKAIQVEKVTNYNSAGKSISSTSSSINSTTETKHSKIKRRHREDYKLVTCETNKKGKHRKEMVQSMSETEYDRMNSDVNSTGNSSSDGEDICPTVVTAKSETDVIETLELKKDNYEEDKVIEIGSSSNLISKNENNTVIEDGSRPVQPGETSHPEMASDDPFILWYKEAHAPGMTGSVSCYIWENDELKKTNLSLLDIGWSIIQAVERHEQDKSYSGLGFFIIIVLCFTPVFFRMYVNRIYLSTALNMSRNSTMVDTILSQNVTALYSLIIGINSNTSVALANSGLQNSSFDHIYSWTEDIIPLILSSILASEWPIRFLIIFGIILRLTLYTMTFLMLCVAENSFEQRLQYAKHFCRLTSSRRARKYYLPHFRLNKLANIKCWLSLRSYLKKRGPQRSVESIISSAFYMLLAMLSLVCVNLLQSTDNLFVNRLINWDLMLCSVALGIFMMRFLVLGTKITKKYRNLSVIITEQINLFLAMQTRPHKKEELTLAHNVLRLAESLLKEVEGPFRICGWSMNPFLYNILKVVILSVFSTVLSETCGFKMKLYKIKINPANW